MPCSCKYCANCACVRAKTPCTQKCHGSNGDAGCQNTEEFIKCNQMSVKDVKKALGAAGLSIIGNKKELVTLLAQHLRANAAPLPSSSAMSSSSSAGGSEARSYGTEALMQAIMACGDNYSQILSLGGTPITRQSPHAHMRKAYLALSRRVHPDKNGQSKQSKEAFQQVVTAFERILQPTEEEQAAAAKERTKNKYTLPKRSNSNCYKTVVLCPRCSTRWGTADMGLEPAAYTFFMLGLKEYICGACACAFGCMSAVHLCPHCKKPLEGYDPLHDYHRQVTCGNAKCGKPFGFFLCTVSDRRMKEVQDELNADRQRRMKEAKAKKRRQDRANRRDGGDGGDYQGQALQELLFCNGLVEECPRCGASMEEGEDGAEHLANCNDTEAIDSHSKRKASRERRKGELQHNATKQEEMMALQQWQVNGKQVGQLWMLPLRVLSDMCKDCGLDPNGSELDCIKRLAPHLRAKLPLSLTHEGGAEKKGILKTGEHVNLECDTSGLAQVQDSDLPTNLWEMEAEDVALVCASYGLEANEGDNKQDLIKKFEKVRYKYSPAAQAILGGGAGEKKRLRNEGESSKRSGKSGGKKRKIEQEDEDFVGGSQSESE